MKSNQLLEDFLQHRPVDPVSIRSVVYRLMQENQALRNASHISQENKNYYLGKVKDSQSVEITCEHCGNKGYQLLNYSVSWYAISQVLSLVQKRSGITL